MEIHHMFVVIGGGIAGVSCAESIPFWYQNADVLLITASPVVKAATSAVQLTKTLVQFEVAEVDASTITEKNPGVKILTDIVVQLDAKEHFVVTKNGFKIFYTKLCICTGGRPNLIDEGNPYVIGIRDTESVLEFKTRVSSARRMVIVGNGGIASEIIYEVKNIEKIWVVRDDHISKTFVDAGAAEFFREKLINQDDVPTPVIKRFKYAINEREKGDINHPALGPDWHAHFDIKGCKADNVIVEYDTSISQISKGDDDYSVKVTLTNGKIYQADFVVSATGVTPNSQIFQGNLKIAEDKGILVNSEMQTSSPDVYAAGDVCTAGWDVAEHWHQMRLWTQARQMGMYAAKCMASSVLNEPILQDFCFEIFSHVTKLFGFKVILLGLFNGQKLGNEYELLLRVTKGLEFIKVVLKDGKMQGAILIGETDLEEMCENLILNQLDLTPYGEDLLNPNIDIEDYFD